MSTSASPQNQDIASDAHAMKWILTDDYNRQRVSPDCSDELYLHLSDLRLALTDCLAGASGQWLDYGSNTSPYRDLLGDASLKQADVRETPTLDYLIAPGEPCPAGNASFDGIISTQVLEHVRDVAFYLKDCRRMLKDSGKLVLTTHGIWEDHGCPDDYWRWTSDGLREELERAGFVVERCQKLTTELRALLQLAIYKQDCFMGHRRSSFIGMILYVIGRSLRRHRGWIARFCDAKLSKQRISDDRNATIYLALVAVARKAPDHRD